MDVPGLPIQDISTFTDVMTSEVIGGDKTSIAPIVSVVIASYNSEEFIEDCLWSVTAQTLRDIEIIVVDDASDDRSAVIVDDLSRTDRRVKVIRTDQRGGPAQARNSALDICRGRWIAIVDSDDVLHRERLALLTETAEESAADIVADNQILFQRSTAADARTLLRKELTKSLINVTCAEYVRSNSLLGRSMPLGYLKPLIRRSFLEENAIRYNPDLPIAEDYDLVLRLLLAGASFRIMPCLTYFYRRHPGSTSFRLTPDALVRMLRADQLVTERADMVPSADVFRALADRRQSIETVLAFTRLVVHLKRRDLVGFIRSAADKPVALRLFAGVLKDRIARLLSRRQTKPVTLRRQACVLSRQRVVGATNGSSAYLLGICEAFRGDGWIVDLVCPSPAMFGRWPVFRLRPEMSVFRSISIRGAFRVGPFVIAKNPAIAARAVLAVADHALKKIGFDLGEFARKAPHAIAVPFADEDRLFVASHTNSPSLVIADYAFLTAAIPYVIAPRARSAVIMHDLFSAQQTCDRPVTLDLEREVALLSAADVVVAIQQKEAEVVAAELGAHRVIVTPMSARPVENPSTGDGRTVMFVGSNTLPNADAVEWLLSEIWPKVVDACPWACLAVAGSVCQVVRAYGRSVHFLGRLDTLETLYQDASVVVSPLRSGSGLKVKLVEALAHGKALVGTGITFQGVEHLADTAAICTDDAPDFAAAIISLLRDEGQRRTQGARALAAASIEFTPEASHAELLRFAREGGRLDLNKEMAGSRKPRCVSNVETVSS